MVTKEQLLKVHHENIRTIQNGGEFDGISPEVAEDIGYESPERMREIISKLGTISTASIEIELGEDPDDSANPSSTVESIRPTSPIRRAAIELPREGRSNSSNFLAEVDRQATRLRDSMTPEEMSEQDAINKRGAKKAREALRRAVERQK